MPQSSRRGRRAWHNTGVRYTCPSCGRWVRPLVDVTAVTCLHCGVYARREEEEQPALLEASDAEKLAPEEQRAHLPQNA